MAYGQIVAQMVLMGLGLGLTTAPATESILSVLPAAKAGVDSAVNDATREAGGTLGVAVLGSIFTSLYADRIGAGAFAVLPEPVRRRLGRGQAPNREGWESPSRDRSADPRITVLCNQCTMQARVLGRLRAAHPQYGGRRPPNLRGGG
jgi:hypothetical protein